MTLKKRKYQYLKTQLNEVIQVSAKEAKKEGKEICGLLVDNGYFIELVQVENKVKKGGGFSFYYKEIRAIQKAVKVLSHEIIGTFHSHPSYINAPGGTDIENALDDSFMLIIDVIKRKAGFWHIKNGKAREITFKLI